MLADLIDVRDVGMIEGRGSLGLLFEAAHPIFLRGKMGRQKIQRNIAVQPRIFRQIDFAHAALAKLRADFVTAEFGGGFKRHFFSAAVQFNITVRGAPFDSSTSMLSRNFWPSALTA